MTKGKNRRRWVRELIAEPELGVIQRHSAKKPPPKTLFVGVHDRSQGGTLIDSAQVLKKGEQVNVSLYDSASRLWTSRQAEVARVQPADRPEEYMAGLKFLQPGEMPKRLVSDPPQAVFDDLEFLLNTSMIKAIPQSAVWPLLNCLTPKNLPAGKKLISQGDKGKSLYIIQQGTCLVTVKNNGEFHQVAQLKKGDVVGEMAVLTGEPRYAGVVAETDLKLWELGKKQFEEVSAQHPDLRMFLTDLVSNRLENSPHTADRTIGKYKIKFKIGSGAWSIVYHGVHNTLNMPVAVKMLKHQMAMDPEFHERFKKEAEIIGQMNHRNIIHVYDIEELYQTVFIVMEHLEGEPLEDILKRTGPLSYARAVNFLVQLAAGLSYAHQKGIVHQDIKPANILIQAEDQLKILDFGLACPTGFESVDLEGTLYYMAPEQIEGDPVDARTDIYSMGINAYEMLIGERPYPEDDLAELMDMHIEEDIPDPREKDPNIPEALRRFIIKACQREPNKRYRDVDEALAELTPLYQELVTGNSDLDHEKKRMTTMFFFYKEEQRGTLNQLLEELSSKAEKAGILLKAADFKDVY